MSEFNHTEPVSRRESAFNQVQALLDAVVAQRDEANNKLAAAMAHIRYLEHQLAEASTPEPEPDE
jgi:hypothetical protein